MSIILTLAANHIAHRFLHQQNYCTWSMNPGVFNFLEVLLTSLYGNTNHYNCVKSAALEDMKNEVVDVVERGKKVRVSEDNEMDTSKLMRFISKILGLNLKLHDLKWHKNATTRDGVASGDSRVIMMERHSISGVWECTLASGDIHDVVTELVCWCEDTDPITVLLRALFGDVSHAECVTTWASEMLAADSSKSKRQKAWINAFSAFEYVAAILDIYLFVFSTRAPLSFGEVDDAVPVYLRFNKWKKTWTCDTVGVFSWQCPICDE
jgi:hypothetical protein